MNIPAPHVNVPSPNRLRLNYEMPSSPIGYRNLDDDGLVDVIVRFLEADENGSVNVNRIYLALRGTPWATARARIKKAMVAAEAIATRPVPTYVGRVGETELVYAGGVDREDVAALAEAEAAPRAECTSCKRPLRNVMGLEIGHYPTCPERQAS
jgi:hypothetical protein